MVLKCRKSLRCLFNSSSNISGLKRCYTSVTLFHQSLYNAYGSINIGFVDQLSIAFHSLPCFSFPYKISHCSSFHSTNSPQVRPSYPCSLKYFLLCQPIFITASWDPRMKSPNLVPLLFGVQILDYEVNLTGDSPSNFSFPFEELEVDLMSHILIPLMRGVL